MSDWDEDTSPDRARDLDREWQQRREQHFNTGFREGLDQGKETVLQQGFDTGFSFGSKSGYAWGILQGAVATLNTTAMRAHSASSDKDAIQNIAHKLQIPHKQVMLTQCDALLQQEGVHGATDGRSSTEAAVISNAKPSAQELHALMQSVHADLQELGYPAKPCIRKGN